MTQVLKALVLLAVTALVLVGCSSSSPSSGSAPSAVPFGSPTPSANPADSKAANLRTQLDLLFEEHVMVVAKQATAASNHTDEYPGYATLLTTNANALVDLVRSAFGNSAASQFEHAWAVQNGYLVDYTIGLVTHNDNKSNGAMSGLISGFVPQFAQLIASLMQLPPDSITQLETVQLTDDKTMIDDEIAQSYSKLYADLRAAYAGSAQIGDMLAIRMAQQFPDKFPGDPTSNAVEARVSLNGLLQEDSYLTTMTSDAVTGGRAAESAAALSAMASTRGELGTVFSYVLGPDIGPRIAQLWGTRDTDAFEYASAGDAAAQQRLTGSFVSQFAGLSSAPADVIRSQVVATIKVLDDQRAKALQKVAGDDRAAATAMQAVASWID